MSTLKSKTSRCVVTVTVTVEGGPYGPEWNLGDAVAQAEREAIDKVKLALQDRRDIFVGDIITCTRVVIDA